MSENLSAVVDGLRAERDRLRAELKRIEAEHQAKSAELKPVESALRALGEGSRKRAQNGARLEQEELLRLVASLLEREGELDENALKKACDAKLVEIGRGPRNGLPIARLRRLLEAEERFEQDGDLWRTALPGECHPEAIPSPTDVRPSVSLEGVR